MVEVYSVEGDVGGKEDIDEDDEDLTEMEKDFPVEGLGTKSYVYEAKLLFEIWIF